MTILRLLAVKGIITTREFDTMYDKTLRELKEDVIRNLMYRHDMELESLARHLGKL